MEYTKEPHTKVKEPPALPVQQAPGLWHRSKNFANAFWINEISASILSLGTFGGIIAILLTNDALGVDYWEYTWSLSSTIGLLATISQMSMAFTLTSCISQMKWTWYRQSRKLTDLDKFDQGSRGPLGAIKLLFSKPFKSIASFGAIITICTIAFHTLIQNAISTRGGTTQLFTPDDLAASFPQGNNYTTQYSDYSSGEELFDQGPSLDMVAAITYGMFYPVMHPDTQALTTIAHCPTGNCTWQHIQTLSVCSACANITSQVVSSAGVYALNGTAVRMNQTTGLVVSLGNSEYPGLSVYPDVDIGPLIAHVSIMARRVIDEEPSAVDCVFYWCVGDQSDVRMVNWNITESNIAFSTNTSSSAHTTHLQDSEIILTPPKCYDTYGLEIANATNCTKTVSSHAQLALQNYLTSEKSGFTGSMDQNLTSDGWDISSEAMKLIWSYSGSDYNLTESMETIMNNIALLMTSNIQQSSYQTGNPESFGFVDMWSIRFKFRWQYLIVPALLVVGSVSFMVVVILMNKGLEKWKYSLLPLLYHPLAEDVRPDVAPGSLAEIKAAAEIREVRLQRGATGSHFV